VIIVFPRIREIVDGVGARLRVSMDACPTGALIVLEEPGDPRKPHIILDAYGTELLGGYIMSARLALPTGLPDEEMDGSFPSTFKLVSSPEPAILILQRDGRKLRINSCFWDKLYGELCMVLAHTRDRSRQSAGLLH